MSFASGGQPLRQVAVSILVLALSVLPAAVALDPLGLQDDAATGGDAPDAIGDAVTLAPGAYSGKLDRAVDASDWFATPDLAGKRMRIVYEASGALLRVHDAAGTIVHQGFSSGTTTFYLGSLGSSYRFSFAIPQSGALADYSFRLSYVEPAVQSDAGLPGDASTATAHARPIGAGLHAGLLDVPAGDLGDAYALSAPAGLVAVVTVTPEPGRSIHFALLDTAGWGLASGTTSTSLTLRWSEGLGFAHVSTGAMEDAAGYAIAVVFAASPDPPQNDAGTGADAPFTVEGAPWLSPGSYQGRLEYAHGDDTDNYRLLVPAGHLLTVTVSVDEGFLWAGLYDAAGPLDNTPLQGGSVAMRAPAGTYTLSLGDAARTSALARYRVDVELVPMPWLEMGTIYATDAAESADPFEREIRVPATNVGAGAFEGTLIVFVYEPQQQFLVAPILTHVTLAAGASRDIVVPWDTKTYVGEFSVIAYAIEGEQPDGPVRSGFGEGRVNAAVDPGLGIGVGTEPDPLALALQ